ncbi:Antibiotic biosynthesis monooxygenase, partial [Dysosmobacter welbionis]
PGLLDGPVCGRERICRPLHPGGSGAGGIGETGESVPTLHRLNGKTPASYRGRRLFEKQVSPSARRSRRAVRRASPARGRARGGRPSGFPWPPWES